MSAPKKKTPAPVTRKIGARRVQTVAKPGHTSEPVGETWDDEPDPSPSTNEERLRADKPPHY